MPRADENRNNTVRNARASVRADPSENLIVDILNVYFMRAVTTERLHVYQMICACVPSYRQVHIVEPGNWT